MKRITTAALLLILSIGNIGALDTESYQFIDHLLSISAAREPEIFEDGVIFTASGLNRRVGIAFAHEGFSKIHWFQRLWVPEDQGPPTSKKERPVTYLDMNVLFYAYTPPENVQELGYRLILDGLWTTDPLNLQTRTSSAGLAYSTLAVPARVKVPVVQDSPPGFLNFGYYAPPGEHIALAGSFNGWDPFMYELRETSPGFYSLSLALPPGTYQYVFIHQGERIHDPRNSRRVYTREGKIASEAVVR